MVSTFTLAQSPIGVTRIVTDNCGWFWFEGLYCGRPMRSGSFRSYPDGITELRKLNDQGKVKGETIALLRLLQIHSGRRRR